MHVTCHATLALAGCGEIIFVLSDHLVVNKELMYSVRRSTRVARVGHPSSWLGHNYTDTQSGIVCCCHRLAYHNPPGMINLAGQAQICHLVIWAKNRPRALERTMAPTHLFWWITYSNLVASYASKRRITMYCVEHTFPIEHTFRFNLNVFLERWLTKRIICTRFLYLVSTSPC